MDIEGLVIFDAKSGIPLFSRLGRDIDPSLFSSFITAIGHFTRELKLGGLASFTTEEKMIFLAARETTITALIAPTRKEFQEAYSLASELGKQFEALQDTNRSLQPGDYVGFNQTADEFLRKIKNPFTSRVAEFVHDKYGGSISIKPRLMKESGAEVTLDMVANLGIRHSDEDEAGKKDAKIHQAFSESHIFCKVSEGRLSRGEIMEFVDSVDGFGVRVLKKDGLEFIPYFPTRAVIVAREYTDQVFDFISRLPKDGDNVYIDGSHIFAGRRLGVQKDAKCYVDLYKWRDNEEPEQIRC
jgi:hypothetical protein